MFYCAHKLFKNLFGITAEVTRRRDLIQTSLDESSCEIRSPRSGPNDVKESYEATQRPACDG